MLFMIGIGLSLIGVPCKASKRHFTVADDIALTYFGDLYTGQVEPITFSPDGRYFVVETERGLIEKNRPESNLRIYRSEDVRRFLNGRITDEPTPVWQLSKSTYKDAPIITHIRWVADSGGVAFLVKTQSGNDQLIFFELRTNELHTLTSRLQHVTGFDIRDRFHFVYSVQSPAVREKAVAESNAMSIVATGRHLFELLFPGQLRLNSTILNDASELWVVSNGRRFRVKDDLSGRPVPLYSDGQRLLSMSPDGRSIVTAFAVDNIPHEWEVLYTPPYPSAPYRIQAGRQDLTALDGHNYVSQYALVDVSTGKVKPLTNAPLGLAAGWWGLARPNWSFDSQSVVLSDTFLPHDPPGLDSHSSRPCVAVANLMHHSLTCVEFLKGQQKGGSYEEGFHYVQSARFAFHSASRITVNYWRPKDAFTGSTDYAQAKDGSWATDSMSSDLDARARSFDVFVKQALNESPVLVATDNTTKTSRVIWDPNPQLRDIDFGEASVFRWKDINGRDWIAGLYKPPNYVRGQHYPLVIQTHGFDENQFNPSGLDPSGFAARELAASGIVVLQVRDCAIHLSPEEGACQVAGYDSAVAQLTAEDIVDPNSVGIVGFSRSVYYVMEALTTGGVHFKAASITDGNNEGYLQYITSVNGFGDIQAQNSNATIGARPFGEGLQAWLKRSPVFNMDEITTPLLVVANGRPSLLFQWEPYAALRYLNKPVELMLLAEGTHVVTNPAQRMILQTGTVDWFRFWLKGEEDLDPAKTAQYTRWRKLREMLDINGNLRKAE
jgi:hypothetical protein